MIRDVKQSLHAHVRTFTCYNTSFKWTNQCTDGCMLSHFELVAVYTKFNWRPTGTRPATVTDFSFTRLKRGKKRKEEEKSASDFPAREGYEWA